MDIEDKCEDFSDSFLFSFFFLDNESGYSNPLRYNCCNFVAERLQTGINVDFF